MGKLALRQLLYIVYLQLAHIINKIAINYVILCFHILKNGPNSKNDKKSNEAQRLSVINQDID